MKNKVKIFVAVHKPTYKYGDNTYQFIHVGAELRPDVNIEKALVDNGKRDNISDRNNIYCELTGLYFIWKHIKDVEYTGLVHYRRFLSNKKYTLHPNDEILKKEEIIRLLGNYDIIVGESRKKSGERDGYFRIKEDLPEFCFYRLVKPAIKELYPDYLDDFEAEFYIQRLFVGNIMICRKSLLDEYCEWLFSILQYVENYLTISPIGISPRELGYFSEYLMNVWIRKKKLKICEKPILFIDNTDRWVHKIRLVLNVLGLNKFVRFLEFIYLYFKKR